MKVPRERQRKNKPLEEELQLKGPAEGKWNARMIEGRAFGFLEEGG
jgi:hypothetical protein